MHGDELIIRPIKTIGDCEFTKQILSDLIKKSLSGEELFSEFKKLQAQIRLATETMPAKSEDIAVGKTEYATYENIFISKD